MRYGNCRRPRPSPSPDGFTYIGVLIAVAVIGAVLAAAGTVWHTAQQRERERELLFAGDHIRSAIGRYYNAGTGTAHAYPQRLKDLVRDPRQPSVIRYLRKIYYDPMTGTRKWGLIKTHDGRVMGIYSISHGEPIKQANFDKADRAFEGRKKYSEWTFVYLPRHARRSAAKAQADKPAAPASAGTSP